VTSALALLASLVWGTSDFVGGTLSRRLPTLVVLAAGQAASTALLSTVLLVGLALGTGGAPSPGALAWSAGAGVAWAGGMAAFYRALAVGTMGVVAPVASTGMAVPVLVGLWQGERLGPLQVVGVVAALCGVMAAAGPEVGTRPRGSGSAPLLLAATAAVLFGVELTLLAHGAESSVTGSLLAMRAAALVTVLRAARGTRTAFSVARRRDLLGPAALGLLDLAATAAYAAAARAGALGVVAVLASLYPAVTVLLARRLHQERLRPVQAAGVVAVLGATVCLGLGGAA
jgi:drug/metabolite transporter (DMT)-like permease